MSIMQHIDDYDLTEFTKIAAGFGQERYGYVVTPNVDHLIRCHDDAAFRAAYADATYVLLDSRFLSHLLKWTAGIAPRVCTGSDLTARLLSTVIEPDDRIVLIGGSALQAEKLAERFRLRRLRHYNPPMGFIRDPDEVERCLQYIESASPFRFCLLAVGAPQQERIAQLLKSRGRARGLGLCVGASINFLTDLESRAPGWMQRAGLEWLFRLVQNPRRLAYRYLIRGPRVFFLLHGMKIVLRRATS